MLALAALMGRGDKAGRRHCLLFFLTSFSFPSHKRDRLVRTMRLGRVFEMSRCCVQGLRVRSQTDASDSASFKSQSPPNSTPLTPANISQTRRLDDSQPHGPHHQILAFPEPSFLALKIHCCVILATNLPPSSHSLASP